MNYPNNQSNQNNDFSNQQYMMYQMHINQEKKKQRTEILKLGFGLGAVILLYLGVQTLVSLVLMAIPNDYALYKESSIFQSAFNVIGVHICSMLIPFALFAYIFKKNYTKPVFFYEKMSAKKAIPWIFVGLGFCYLANIITAMIINITKEQTGHDLSNIETAKPDSLTALFMSVIAVVIIPGIIEELAFRGCILGAFRKYGKGFGVFIAALSFGLLHGNFVQFIFTFMVGAILGYIAIKTNNIIICMVIHAMNNGLSTLQDALSYFVNDKFGTVAVNVVFCTIFIISIICLFYLISQYRKEKAIAKQFAPPQKQINPYDNNIATKLACLLPGMIVPIIIFFYIALTHVS